MWNIFVWHFSFVVKPQNNMLMLYLAKIFMDDTPPSPICLHFVIMESWRMLEVPGGSWQESKWLEMTSTWKRANFYFDEKVPRGIFTLCVVSVSRASSKCHPWSLRGCWGFLRGVLVVFDIMNDPRIHQGSCISIFNSIPARKVLQLLGSPERHPSVILGV